MISVILPIYNVEIYLKKCLDSIINQTYKDLEIILIDDGSTDSSGDICDEYQMKDNRIKVIHKINEGQAKGRNVGLDMATGEYIAFVDSDDWLEPEMFAYMIQTFKKTNSDVVQCGLKQVYANQTIYTDTDEVFEFTPLEAVENLMSEKNIRFEVWNKVYTRSSIGEIRFKEGQLHEEVYFTPRVLLNAKKVVHIDKPFYNYLLDRPGNTNSTFNDKRLASLKEFEELSKMFVQTNKNLSLLIDSLTMKYTITFYLIAYKNGVKNEAIFVTILEHFNRCIRNKDNPYIRQYRMKATLFKICPPFYAKLTTFRDKLKR